MPPNRKFVRGRADAPLTAALDACRATETTRRDFRILRADRELQVPLLSRDCEVWALPGSPLHTEGKHHWRVGIRLAPMRVAKVGMRQPLSNARRLASAGLASVH